MLWFLRKSKVWWIDFRTLTLTLTLTFFNLQSLISTVITMSEGKGMAPDACWDGHPPGV